MDARGRPREYFATTHWSVVLAAGGSDSTRARLALDKLCLTYWYPLYAFVRRRGYPPEDAQDLTQEFFARLLEQNWVQRADRERGRLRSFLLAVMNHFLAGEWDKARARKRGGGLRPIPLEADTAETRYCLEPADPVTAEKIYERRWALTLLETVLNKLRREYEREGKKNLFAKLESSLARSRDSVPYAEVARQLAMHEGAVRTAVHRLRKRYRELLRSEIADTVLDEAEVEEELRYLFRALAD